MPKHVPETGNDVEGACATVEILGAHRPKGGLWWAATAHDFAWFQKDEIVQARGRRDAHRACAIACADIQHGLAAGRDFGDDQPIDSIEIRPALLRQTGVYGRDLVVGGDGVD